MTREEAIKILTHPHEEYHDSDGNDGYTFNTNKNNRKAFEMAIEALKRESVIHAKWIEQENLVGLEHYYKCSNCNNHCLYEYVEIGFKNSKSNYCPNCGAKMDE